VFEIVFCYFTSVMMSRRNVYKVLQSKHNKLADEDISWLQFNSFSSGDKFHIFHSIPSDINISTSIYPPLKRKPPLKSS
jgi:hypothetical protein